MSSQSQHDPRGWASRSHPRLFIPGPTEVRPEVLDAQTALMIGHRTPEFQELFGRVQQRLRRLFFTEHRVYVTASSGTGLWEGAIRNGVRLDTGARTETSARVLSFINGAFSERWADVVEACGRAVVRIEVPWGEGITPDTVQQALQEHGRPEAITLAHNETSTGVISPLEAIAAVVHDEAPDTFVFVDAVSSFAGAELLVDDWGLDVCLTSSQKALACPAGLGMAAVSDRVLDRAATIEGRGWYFDFLLLERYLARNMTPATPAISLLRALDEELTYIIEGEGIAERFARHEALARRTQEWALSRDFGLFAGEGFRSPTVTTVTNTREIDVGALNAFLRERGMIVSNGYGALKGKTFRIAHMGDTTAEELTYLLETIDEFLAREK